MAHHDRPPFSGRPSLTGHCGHGWICSLPRPVAIDPERHFVTVDYRAATGLLDHLVGAELERRRQFDADCAAGWPATAADSSVRIEGNPISKSSCTPPQRSQASVVVANGVLHPIVDAAEDPTGQCAGPL